MQVVSEDSIMYSVEITPVPTSRKKSVFMQGSSSANDPG